jgi:hypothetical protein
MLAATVFAETETSTRPYAVAAMESTAPEVWYEPAETEAEAEGVPAVEGARPVRADMLGYLWSHLHTHADVESSYNDNIYLVNRPKTGDFVTTVTPGVSFRIGNNLPTPDGKLKSYFEIDTGYKIDYYMANSLNFNNPYLTLGLRGAGNRYLIDFKHYFEKDITTTQRLSPGQQGMTGVERNMTNLVFKYDWKRIGTEAGFRRYQAGYDDPFKRNGDLIDSSLHATVWFKPAFTPKTRFFFEYDFGEYDLNKAANDANNFKYHQFWIGARGDFTKKFSGNLKAGKELRFSYSQIGRCKDSIIVRLNLQYKYSPKLRFVLNAASEDRPSTAVSEGMDKEYRFNLYAIYDLNPRLRITAGGDYILDVYTTDREDNTYGATARLDYIVNRWTTIGIEYKFMTRQSERAGAKYNNSVITGRLGMAF